MFYEIDPYIYYIIMDRVTDEFVIRGQVYIELGWWWFDLNDLLLGAWVGLVSVTAITWGPGGTQSQKSWHLINKTPTSLSSAQQVELIHVGQPPKVLPCVPAVE